MDLHCMHRSCFSFFRQHPTSFLFTVQVLWEQSMDLHCMHRSCFSFFRQHPTSFFLPSPPSTTWPTCQLSLAFSAVPTSAHGLPCAPAHFWYSSARPSSQPAHGSWLPRSAKAVQKRAAFMLADKHGGLFQLEPK